MAIVFQYPHDSFIFVTEVSWSMRDQRKHQNKTLRIGKNEEGKKTIDRMPKKRKGIKACPAHKTSEITRHLTMKCRRRCRLRIGLAIKRTSKQLSQLKIAVQ